MEFLQVGLGQTSLSQGQACLRGELLLKKIIGVQLICNVLLASGVQKSDSIMHIHIFILFSYRLSQNIK